MTTVPNFSPGSDEKWKKYRRNLLIAHIPWIVNSEKGVRNKWKTTLSFKKTKNKSGSQMQERFRCLGIKIWAYAHNRASAGLCGNINICLWVWMSSFEQLHLPEQTSIQTNPRLQWHMQIRLHVAWQMAAVSKSPSVAMGLIRVDRTHSPSSRSVLYMILHHAGLFCLPRSCGPITTCSSSCWYES